MTFLTWLQYLRAIRDNRAHQRRGKRQKVEARRLRLRILEDRTLPSTFTVTSTGDNGGVNPLPGAGTGTLRQAIVDADAAATGTAAAPDLIQFSILTTDPGYNSTTGAFTIQPLSALPTVTDTVVIDGYTEPGASPNTLTIGDNAVLNIVLDGSQAGAVDGLVIAGGNSTVSGLVIDNFAAGSGLVLGGPAGNAVVGNFLGTDVTGLSAAANNNGIYTTAPGNIIGGTTPDARNIISGNNSLPADAADGGTEPSDCGVDLHSSGNLIRGNYIGTDRNGTAAVGNGGGSLAFDGGGGIFDGSSSTNQIIGGTAPGAGNLISGNAGSGIFLGDDSLCLVEGNLIGTNATGTAALGNGAPFFGGILLWGNYNTIGGTTPGARNIISGNANGISIDQVFGTPGHAEHNVVEGNYIGTDITGTVAISGQGVGVAVDGDYNTIGGTTPAARNIISGGGIIIRSGASNFYPGFGNVVQGNYIGTDVSGSIALSTFWGIQLLDGTYDNTIGGSLPGEGNLISGHGGGILLYNQGFAADPRDNVIQGNLIGTDKTGTVALGNEIGIDIAGANNTMIGGTAPGAGNTIAFSDPENGVWVESGTGNSILGNSIFSNSPLGIALTSANNANDNQAAPVLTSVSTLSSGTTISGTLQSAASTPFRVEFFANASMDPSGDGQGQTYLGFATVTTDASGNASLTATISTVVPRGYFISATATNLTTGDTSEFSKDRVVISYLVTNTNDSGPGSLREAIYDANTLAYGTAANPDLIAFDIPTTDAGYNSGTGAFSIQPLSALPTVTDTVVIDGYTEPGASPNTLTIGDNAVLNIVLDGGQAGAVDGLVIAGGNSTVRGLVIDNFAYGCAIVLRLQGNDVVAGNFIGTDVTGASAAANNVGIVTNPNEPILSTGNRIGGTAPADRNIISGNDSAQPISAHGGTNPADFGLDLDNANLIEGNYIGTDKSGTKAVPNGTGIIVGSNNTIGGLTATLGAGAGNLISGNFGFGLVMANQNLVVGNLIGTTATGLAALGNSGGILGGSDNTIGGTTPGARNIISGNTGGVFSDRGIEILGPYNLIEGNYIGTDITGTTVVNNPGGGIVIDSSYNTIGGTTAAARNIIDNAFSGNPITIAQGGGQPPVLGNIVQGNYIGTDVAGTQALANETGIVLEGGVYDTLIGGTVPGAGNVFSGNNESLITLEGAEGDTDVPTNTLIQGNFIGTDESGAMLLGDHGDAETGIYLVDANNTTIGGTVPGAGNTIAINGAYGVYINSGSGNSILGNSIFANSPLGIFLNSANNANNNQAAPVLTSGSTSATATSLSGTLASVTNTTFRIEFFANQGLDPSGTAEGQTFLGFVQVATNASGYLVSSPDGSAVITNPGTANASFTVPNLAAIPAGEGYVTATATNETTGDTSQFSNYLAVPTSMQLTASANPAFFGQPVTLTATVSATFTGFGTPVGSVVFVDTTTGTNLGSASLSGGVAALTTAALNTGPHIITATYAGNTTFLGSSATLSLTVSPSILILDPTASGALSLSGNASVTTAGNVVVDSSSSTALTASGNASLHAAGILVVGRVSKSGNATLSPNPSTGVTTVVDPLAGLGGPSTAGLTNYGSVSYTSGSHTLQPGIYSQIKLSGSASVTLCPGLYLIEGGGLTVTGNASLTGSGVMIYNAGSNYPNPGGSFGGITLSGDGTVSLSASTTGAGGTDPGIVIFQSRANTRALGLSGNAAAGLSGTVYAPAAQLVLGGNATLNSPLVVDELSVSGNGVSTQVIAGATGDNSGTPDTLLAGDLNVYVNDPSGLFTANEQARIQDAIATWDHLLAPYSVVIHEVSDPGLANVVIDMAATSAAGGAAEGVLGCYNDASSEITILQGWNWYDGSDPSQIGAGQYDFQTVVAHELGHALGLGGSDAAGSPMNETLPAGVVWRMPAAADLNIPEAESGADPERAAAVNHIVPVVQAPSPLSIPLTGQAQHDVMLAGMAPTEPHLGVAVAEPPLGPAPTSLVLVVAPNVATTGVVRPNVPSDSAATCNVQDLRGTAARRADTLFQVYEASGLENTVSDGSLSLCSPMIVPIPSAHSTADDTLALVDFSAVPTRAYVKAALAATMPTLASSDGSDTAILDWAIAAFFAAGLSVRPGALAGGESEEQRGQRPSRTPPSHCAVKL